MNGRLRDRDGALAAVFDQAAQDLGGLVAAQGDGRAVAAFANAMVEAPATWTAWAPIVLAGAPPALAAQILEQLSRRTDAVGGWVPLLRALADAAGDPDAYRATFTDRQLRDPSAAAEVAQRFLAADRVAEAQALLEASRPQASRKGAEPRGVGIAGEPDFDWESAWIEVLERSGRLAEAQAARWASFERTLSAPRVRDFTRRLADFDDVEAEGRAFAYAAAQADAGKALAFLMTWAALAEAAQLIQARAEGLVVSPEDAELWGAQLRARQPAAAHLLLRKAAAAAFRRRDFKTCDRLTAEADAIPL